MHEHGPLGTYFLDAAQQKLPEAARAGASLGCWFSGTLPNAAAGTAPVRLIHKPDNRRNWRCAQYARRR